MTTPNEERAGHTPGPWAARREFSSLCIVDAQGDYIADIHDRETYDENLEVEDESASEAEASANARLIAAAPDMKDAIKDVLHFHDSGGHEGDLDEALRLCRAAIAKARGEA